MFGSLAEKLFGQSYYARYALMVSLSQAILVSVLEGLAFTAHSRAVNQMYEIGNRQEVKENPNLSGDFKVIYAQARSLLIYHLLFIVSQLFQLVLCTDAICHQNTIQFIGLSLFIFANFIFSIIQVNQTTSLIVNNGTTPSIQEFIEDSNNLPRAAVPFEAVIIVVLFFISVSFAYLAYRIYQEFGWTIYKKIGADMKMRDRYKMYQIFIMLLKFDVFFFLGFSVQFLALVVILKTDSYEIILHIILAVVLSIVMIIMGFWGIQTEKKVLMYSFMVGCCAVEGYIISKLVDVARNPENKYLGTRNSVIFFLLVCLVLGIITFSISLRCLMNFDKGLKYHISCSQDLKSQLDGPDRLTLNESLNRAYSLETVNRHTQRWSID